MRYRQTDRGTEHSIAPTVDHTACSSTIGLTLRREAGVKLTPDPINCLILKNGFNICKPTFVTFNISLLALICDT